MGSTQFSIASKLQTLIHVHYFLSARYHNFSNETSCIRILSARYHNFSKKTSRIQNNSHQPDKQLSPKCH